ncbi:SAV0927 family protein [Paenibacillus thermoaerophilus]|uniref:SAV0927 family protein n=1 Tax=Paenibacillus thermoaerophilus TaxID=1215385 RepID=A0ABW2V702_9BACL|nr:SAV0927 family protein [Paenibacillus thermoaerophilus]TMV18763.1 DUF3055 family protein [Paenibacillus thermoaerophilus]
MFEKIYDSVEQAQVQYIGYISDASKYDFAIVFSSHFFGKPLVVCLQTNRASILGTDDLDDLPHLLKLFDIKDLEEGKELADLLRRRMPEPHFDDPY